MIAEENLVSSIGYKKFGIDPIEPAEITIPSKLVLEMNKWGGSKRRVFETIFSMTDCGKYGILITGPELKNVVNISLPAVFIAIGFLTESGWIIREKHQGIGQPNVYYINREKFKEYLGDYKI